LLKCNIFLFHTAPKAIYIIPPSPAF